MINYVFSTKFFIKCSFICYILFTTDMVLAGPGKYCSYCKKRLIGTSAMSYPQCRIISCIQQEVLQLSNKFKDCCLIGEIEYITFYDFR